MVSATEPRPTESQRVTDVGARGWGGVYWAAWSGGERGAGRPCVTYHIKEATSVSGRRRLVVGGEMPGDAVVVILA